MNLQRFEIPNTLLFDAGINRLPRAVITTPFAEAHVYLHGAHVTHFQPRGQSPVLFLSRQAWFETGKPIRGGVPLIFPWFGPNRADKSAPQHGLVRLTAWEVEFSKQNPDGSVEIVFVIECAGCRVRHRVLVGERLTLALEVSNVSTQSFTFEEAFHPYFTVGDAREISVEGLEGCDFLDQTESFKKKNQGKEPIRIITETDRVYPGAGNGSRGRSPSIIIRDPVLRRRLVIEKTNAADMVVWNPWKDWAKTKKDFALDEWQRMICVEPANVRDNAVTLAPGQTHRMDMTVGVESFE